MKEIKRRIKRNKRHITEYKNPDPKNKIMKKKLCIKEKKREE